MSEPPISTARPRGKVLRDRRDARVDLVGAGRAFAIRNVVAGAQALTIGRAIGASAGQRRIDRAVYMVVTRNEARQE